jgi:hypothetical protein
MLTSLGQGIKTKNKQKSLTGQTTPQMRAITCDDEAAPWSRSNHLMGTRLLSSSDDSHNNFFRTLHRTRTEIKINQTMLCVRLLNYVYFLYPALILPLFKPKANVCTQKMG